MALQTLLTWEGECSRPGQRAQFIGKDSCWSSLRVKKLLHGVIYILTRIRVFAAMDDLNVIGAKRQIRMYLCSVSLDACGVINGT